MSGQTEIQMRWLQRPYLDLLLVNKSNFDIWNSASRASLTKMKESISRSLGHDRRSLLSSKGFSAAAETAACTDLHRQHVCVFVHKSLRRVEIAPRVGSDDLEPLALRESGGGSVRQSENTHCLLFFTPR